MVALALIGLTFTAISFTANGQDYLSSQATFDLKGSNETINYSNETGLINSDHHVQKILESLKGLQLQSWLVPNTASFIPNAEESPPFSEYYAPVRSPGLTTSGANVNNLRRTLTDMFSKSRHDEVDFMHKEEVRAGILGRLAYYTTESFVQRFEAIRGREEKKLKGSNIIGILPGLNRNQPGDEILVIGAHYDTTKGTPGVNDNGSGTAALLETARLLSPKQGDLNSTIMFVAFDLEEEGILGSLAFVNEYLIPKELIGKKASFAGAYIMDMILNYDPQKRSQTLPMDMTRLVPDAGYWLRSNRYTGDFLAMVSRKDFDNRLLESFRRSWYNWPEQSKYKLLTIEPPIPRFPYFISNYRYRNFMRSDHAAFWNHKNKQYTTSLPAVLITDTGPWRGVQRACYHEFCDDKNQITTENLDFVKRIVDTLVDAALQITIYR